MGFNPGLNPSPDPEYLRGSEPSYINAEAHNKEADNRQVESIFKGLLDGTITLTEGESSGGNEAYINETYHSAFGLGDPVEWSRDQDQLDEESDARL